MLVNLVASVNEPINCTKKVPAFRDYITHLLGKHALPKWYGQLTFEIREVRDLWAKWSPRSTIGITPAKLLCIHWDANMVLPHSCFILFWFLLLVPAVLPPRMLLSYSLPIPNLTHPLRLTPMNMRVTLHQSNLHWSSLPLNSYSS